MKTYHLNLASPCAMCMVPETIISALGRGRWGRNLRVSAVGENSSEPGIQEPLSQDKRRHYTTWNGSLAFVLVKQEVSGESRAFHLHTATLWLVAGSLITF